MVASLFLGLLIISVLVNKENIRVKYSWPLLLAFSSWALFGINEYIAHLYKSNIRIDLLLTVPLIMAISVYAAYFFIRVIIWRLFWDD